MDNPFSLGLTPDDRKRYDQICEQFDRAWERYLSREEAHTAERPEIARFLNDLPPEAGHGLRAALAAELAKIDMERRQQLGEAARAEDYQETLPELQGDPRALAYLAGAGETGPASPASPEAALAIGSTFGDYEVHEMLGRGGMGIVYKAWQASLNRWVALKIALVGQEAPPEEVRRLRREAEAAAHLDHPHIVPIYEVGERGGMHYFTMKPVEGDSLEQRLADFSLARGEGEAALTRREFARRQGRIVELLGTVARAVHHAHRQGILHRDLKPANILLDAEGRPHVTDFGLAKRLWGQPPLEESEAPLEPHPPARAPAAESNQTEAGALVGTPEYMSPEQAEGRRDIQTTADVFSLGVILYQLLTGRAPFKGGNVVDTLLRVREARPTHPRLLSPQIGRDLEAVCLKCLQKEPDERYESAKALADDLGRAHRGEPVEARPAGRIGRVWRWGRRHPGVAGLLTAVFALLLAVAVVSTAAAVRIADSRDAAREAQGRSDRALLDTFQTVDEYFTQVSESPELKEHSAEGLRRALLEKARHFYEEFVARYGGNPERRAVLALAHYRLGLIAGEIGSQQEAIEHTRRGLDLAADLVREEPDTVSHQALLGLSWYRLGSCHHALGQFPQAEEAYGKALGLSDGLLAREPDIPHHRSLRGRILGNLGILHRARGREAEAERAQREALKVYTELAREDPAGSGYLRERALGHNNLAILYRHQGLAGKAIAEHREALRLRTERVQRRPDSPTSRYELSVSHYNLGNLHFQVRDRPEEAENAYGKALEIQEELAQEHPRIHLYRYALAKTRGNLGILHERRGQREKAEEAYLHSLGVLESLVREHPQVAEYTRDLAVTYTKLADLIRDDAQVREKLDWYQKAIPLLRKLVGLGGRYGELRGALFQIYHIRASLLLELRRYDAVIREVEDGLEVAVNGEAGALRTLRALAWAYHGRHAQSTEEVTALTWGPSVPPGTLYELACVMALSVKAAHEDSALSEDEKGGLAERYGREAIALLGRAREAGFFKEPENARRLREDIRLASVRHLPGFPAAR